MTRMQDAAFDLLDAITKLFGVWWVRDHPFRSLILRVCISSHAFRFKHSLFSILPRLYVMILYIIMIIYAACRYFCVP